MAYAMDKLDEAYVAHAAWQTPLADKPSAYLRRQVKCCFQNERVAINNLKFTTEGCLMWGSDYPHGEGTYPHSRQVIKEMFHELPIEVAGKVLGQTAAAFFGMEDIYEAALAKARAGAAAVAH
jgi:hypothetical protein